MTRYVQRGESIDYTPGADVAAGGVVVQGELVGVTTRPIAAGELGALTVEGVFDFTKAAGDGGIFAGFGAYWDEANEVATADPNGGANKQLGKAIVDAASGDTSMRVRMSQAPLTAPAAPLLVSAAFDEGGEVLTLTFDQVVAHNVDFVVGELIVHTATADYNAWTASAGGGNQLIYTVVGQVAPTLANNTLSFANAGDDPIVRGTPPPYPWASIAGVEVTAI